MKIGVFSDVHGHLIELKLTLNLLKSLAVDTLVCGGDLVDKGNFSDDVVDIMREEAIACVQGNHDKKAQFTWLSHAEPLKDSTIEYLTDLPVSLDYEWEDKTVHVCHANPWHDASYYLYPTAPEFLFQEVRKTCTADVIILGHTHHPMSITYKNTLMINPGSIYGNRDRAERTCGVLTMPDCTFTIFDIETGPICHFKRDYIRKY